MLARRRAPAARDAVRVLHSKKPTMTAVGQTRQNSLRAKRTLPACGSPWHHDQLDVPAAGADHYRCKKGRKGQAVLQGLLRRRSRTGDRTLEADREAPRPAADRPTIGLALGGGAARGLAHIGVLRTLRA